MPTRSQPVPVQPPARPLVAAHRGASHAFAEHTLDAYVDAIRAGADALECDVRLTRDGHLVCVHDRTVDRTSDAHGVVSELDLDELSGMDFASWHGQTRATPGEYLAGVAPDRLERGGGVLTLHRLLELVHDAGRTSAGGGPVRLLIETKHPTRYGGLVEKELVDLLARFGWAGRQGAPRAGADPGARVSVMSFASTALRRVRLLAPDVPTVLLLTRKTPGRTGTALPGGVRTAGPSLRLLREDPGLVARSHARGNRVFAWTVDEPGDVDYVCRLGVDAVITNRPAAVIAQLAGGRPPESPPVRPPFPTQ